MEPKKKIIITIDGWSSCGKSTLAKQLARELNYVYIDSGAMYRAITLYFLRNHVDWTKHAAVEKALKNITLEFESNHKSGHTDICLNGEMRDYSDSHREVSPLRQAKDAIVLDNSKLTMKQQLEIAQKWVKERM